MRTLDLIKYGRQNVSFYLALEKYVLNSPEWKNEELFFIWDINPAIVCGKHQLIETEVNLDYAKSLGVPVYRRHSGGGTIFADEGCFMFTFIKRSQKRDDVFKLCLSEVVKAFDEIGLKTELSGRNDLICKGRKFSGNSYYRNENGSILHGTLLYKTDIEKLVRSITPDNEKLVSKGIESVRQRVINVGDYIDLGREELMRHLEKSIADEVITFNESEYYIVKEIEKEYLSESWLKGNNPPYTFRNKERFSFGVIDACVDVKGKKIKSIKFNGDFFTHQDLEPLYSKMIDLDFERDILNDFFDKNPIDEYILGATNKDLLDLFFNK